MAQFGELGKVFDKFCKGPVKDLGHDHIIGGRAISIRIREINISNFGKNIGWIRHVKQALGEPLEIESLELYANEADASEHCGKKVSEKAIAWIWYRPAGYFERKPTFICQTDKPALTRNAGMMLTLGSLKTMLTWGSAPDIPEE